MDAINAGIALAPMFRLIGSFRYKLVLLRERHNHDTDEISLHRGDLESDAVFHPARTLQPSARARKEREHILRWCRRCLRQASGSTVWFVDLTPILPETSMRDGLSGLEIMSGDLGVVSCFIDNIGQPTVRECLLLWLCRRHPPYSSRRIAIFVFCRVSSNSRSASFIVSRTKTG